MSGISQAVNHAGETLYGKLATDTDAEWVRKYKEQNGFDPSYF